MLSNQPTQLGSAITAKKQVNQAERRRSVDRETDQQSSVVIAVTA